MTVIATPAPGRSAAEAFVEQHLGHVVADEVRGSETIRGGQIAADAALAALDIAGYARRRNEVHPVMKRGATRLSPYIRHGLLSLREVWDQVAGAAPRDATKFRDELLWQEYARHWYAQLGHRTRRGIRRELRPAPGHTPWNDTMACIALTVDELENDGWLVNQTRMWIASHWSVRHALDWRQGEDYLFSHLLDGSRAANRMGWQWTTGVGSSKPYGFSRYQVAKRAPGVCEACELRDACPIEDWPDDPLYVSAEQPTDLKVDADTGRTAGPSDVTSRRRPELVWLTAESLGQRDPALAANPDLPAVFVFDEPLLQQLKLSSKRLVFLAETLGDLATARDLEIRVGEPAEELVGREVAVTFAPVPGFGRRAEVIQPVEVHPWPWLVRPNGRSIASFSAWRKGANVHPARR